MNIITLQNELSNKIIDNSIFKYYDYHLHFDYDSHFNALISIINSNHKLTYKAKQAYLLLLDIYYYTNYCKNKHKDLEANVCKYLAKLFNSKKDIIKAYCELPTVLDGLDIILDSYNYYESVVESESFESYLFNKSELARQAAFYAN